MVFETGGPIEAARLLARLSRGLSQALVTVPPLPGARGVPRCASRTSYSNRDAPLTIAGGGAQVGGERVVKPSVDFYARVGCCRDDSLGRRRSDEVATKVIAAVNSITRRVRRSVALHAAILPR